MRSNYKYDVFISFAHEDKDLVRPIYQSMQDLGLKVFWSEEKLETGVAFPPQLQDALMLSQNFSVYFSRNAKQSRWVEKECDIFLNEYHMKDTKNRRMFVLMNDTTDESDLPMLLRDIHRPQSPELLIAVLVNTALRDLEGDLARSNKKLEMVREFYRYNRFWNPLAKNKDVHIFTCARNVTHDPRTMRGQYGRTNIDMWDYRAVLDITHFFASSYPGAMVTIEDPMSKLDVKGLAASQVIDWTEMRSMLENKDCIIIGSPDVSDFAEIVLAKIHRIKPYTDHREKRKGFVIIKDLPNTQSSFYWKKETKDKEGVAQIFGPNDYKCFEQKIPLKEDDIGKMYGILVVANNPFCESGQHRKIVILSGFSGVATNAISKLLTDDCYLSEFFEFDEAYANTDRNIEALIGVEYTIGPDAESRDTRRIREDAKAITFEALVEI